VRAVLRVDSRLRGATEAIRCMSRLAKLCFRYLCDRGFYIGIDDVTPLKRMLSLKQDILRGGHTRLAEFISNPDVMPFKLESLCSISSLLYLHSLSLAQCVWRSVVRKDRP